MKTGQLVPLFGDPGVAVGQCLNVLQMTVIGLDATIAELRQLCDSLRQCHRLGRIDEAVTAEPHVDVDKDADRRILARMGGKQIDPGLAVDNHHESYPSSQRRTRAAQPSTASRRAS